MQSGWSQLSPALTFDPLPIPASAAFVAGSHVASVSLVFCAAPQRMFAVKGDAVGHLNPSYTHFIVCVCRERERSRVGLNVLVNKEEQ